MAEDGKLSYVCGNENTRMIKLNLSELRARLEYGTKTTINLSFLLSYICLCRCSDLSLRLSKHGEKFGEGNN